jgi:hypothetical protein
VLGDVEPTERCRCVDTAQTVPSTQVKRSWFGSRD